MHIRGCRSRAGVVLLLTVAWILAEGALPALAQYYTPRRHRRFVGTTGPRRTVAGVLASVDLAGEALVVRSRSGGNLRILVDDQTHFSVGGSRASLRDLRSGASVSVTYFQYSGVWVADQVSASSLKGSSRGDSALGYDGRGIPYGGRGGPYSGGSAPYGGRSGGFAPAPASPYTAGTGRSQSRRQELTPPPGPRTTTGGWTGRGHEAGSSTRSQPPPRRHRPPRPPDDSPPGRRAL